MKTQYLTKARIFDQVKEYQHPQKIGWNTWQYTSGNGDEVIRYSYTDIIRKTKNGEVILSSGGWKTATTKRKINSFLEGCSSYKVYQIKGIWYLGQEESRQEYVFFDGLQLMPDGTILKTAENIQSSIIETTFNSLNDHFSGIDTDHVETLCRESFKEKEKVNVLLGLHEGNEFRHSFPVEIDHQYFETIYPHTNTLFKKVTNGKAFNVIENTVVMENGQKMRLSRFLAKNKEKIHYQDDDIIQQVYREMGIQSLDDLSIFRDKVKSKTCVISTNPYDIITATENASFSSCYRFDGEYFNSTLALCRMPNVAIVYLYDRDITRKIGRSWVYLFPDALKFIMLKGYGSIYEGERKAVRAYIEHQFAKTYGIKNKWKKSAPTSYGDVLGHCNPIYFDSSEVTKVRHYSVKDKQEPIQLLLARCLYCGNKTANQRGGGCRECSNCYTCSDCGYSLQGDDVYSDETYDYCSQCFDERYFYCVHCNERTDINEECYVDGLGAFCYECHSERYVQCDSCNADLDRNKSTYFCPDHEGGTYCEECYDKKYVRCNECEEEIDKPDSKEHRGNYYCVVCYSRANDLLLLPAEAMPLIPKRIETLTTIPPSELEEACA